MAVIWQKNIKGKLYQVRSAGATRRLYTDGIFHSQFNPNVPVGGSVWDLLMLPAFFLDAVQVKRVLVLGVGGGAVIGQLNHFFDIQRIVEVELNKVHIQVAKRHFGTIASNVRLVEADAVAWLKQYRGPKFDLIVEDLFGEQDGEPVRAVADTNSWCWELLRSLSDHGVLVMNYDTPAQFNASTIIKQQQFHSRLPQVFKFSTSLYDNCVAAFLSQQCSAREFRQRKSQYPALNETLAGCRLNYRLQKIR